MEIALLYSALGRHPEKWDANKIHVRKVILDAASRRGVSEDALESDIKQSLNQFDHLEYPFRLKPRRPELQSTDELPGIYPELLPECKVTLRPYPKRETWWEMMLHWRSQRLVSRVWEPRITYKPSPEDSPEVRRELARFAAFWDVIHAHANQHQADLNCRSLLPLRRRIGYHMLEDRCVVLNLDTREVLFGRSVIHLLKRRPTDYLLIPDNLMWLLAASTAYTVKDFDNAYFDYIWYRHPEKTKQPRGRWAGYRLVVIDAGNKGKIDGVGWNGTIETSPGWLDVSLELCEAVKDYIKYITSRPGRGEE